jgi:hypothetical protein
MEELIYYYYYYYQLLGRHQWRLEVEELPAPQGDGCKTATNWQR